jgi:3-dehydrosphinganine reductase
VRPDPNRAAQAEHAQGSFQWQHASRTRLFLSPEASSGIGLATARAFAHEGAHVVLVARNQEKLEKARNEVQAHALSDSQKIVAVPCDVSDADSAERAAREAESRCGPIDILVNCAGIFLPEEFLTHSPELFRKHIEIDLFGVVNMTRAVAPSMVARGRGSIVNVSSMAGFIGVYGYTAYSAAKFGLMGFSEALRSELKPHGVTVSVVCPPDVDTPGLAAEKEVRPPETEKIAGTVKAWPPEAVARVILAAASSRKFLHIPGATNAFLFRLKGIFPELFYWVFDWQIASVRNERAQTHKAET